MSQEATQEELTILAAIDNLARGADPAAEGGPRGDETAETLARLYTEVLGLIPHELVPVPPSPEARSRLLAAIGAARRPVPVPVVPASVSTGAAEPEPLPVAPAVTAPIPLPGLPAEEPAVAPAVAPVTEAPRPTPRVGPGPLPRRQSRWPLALAAALALVFAGSTLWLMMARADQRAMMAEMRQELETQRKLSEQATQEGRQAQTEMEKMRDRFALVTSPSVEVRPLKPVGDQPQARGMLFVAADHQHWYLSLEGLRPTAPGEVYKLWWLTEEGVLDAGSLVAQGGEKVQMGSDQMPAGTRDIVVTLEPAGSGPRPTGIPILQAGP